MTPEQARFLAEYLLGAYEMEIPATLRVLKAVPDDQGGYAPDPTSMNALTLAWHIAEGELYFLRSIASMKFEKGSPGIPPEIQKPSDVVARYEAQRPEAVARVRSMSGEDLATVIDVLGVFQAPVVHLVGFMTHHSIHHRGQLSAYLRPMGAKVPSIYGPSADEPAAM